MRCQIELLSGIGKELTEKVEERQYEDDVASNSGDTKFEQLCTETEAEDHDRAWKENTRTLNKEAKRDLIPTRRP